MFLKKKMPFSERNPIFMVLLFRGMGNDTDSEQQDIVTEVDF